METILFLAYTESDGSLAKPALESLSAARNLSDSISGSKFVVGLIGAQVQPAADLLAACGASRFLGVTGPEFELSRYSTDILAAEALGKASGASIMVVPATSRSNRVMAGAAQRLGGRIDTHATGIFAADGRVSVTRWYYRQRMEGVLSRSQRPWVLLLESGCAPVWSGTAGSAAVESISVAVPTANLRTAIVGVQAPAADAQTIRPDAKLLFVAGAGWTKTQPDGKAHPDEAEKIILDFLGKAKASLGSTKSLVDLSGEGQAVLKFMTHLNQIGQTGATPRHPKGLSTCCHGEEPHTVGWRFINERRAINLNAACSWAQGKADVLYVADSFAVMKKVNELLAAK